MRPLLPVHRNLQDSAPTFNFCTFVFQFRGRFHGNKLSAGLSLKMLLLGSLCCLKLLCFVLYKLKLHVICVVLSVQSSVLHTCTGLAEDASLFLNDEAQILSIHLLPLIRVAGAAA